jgi:hypothetical protein
MSKTTLPPPKVRKGISSKELAQDSPDADKAPPRPDDAVDQVSSLQRITGKWPINNF